jgi:nitroreductase
MTITEAIEGRASIRAFTTTPVANDTVRRILETARWAPSGVNTQPWQVAVVTGAKKQTIGDRIVAARKADQKPNPDYQYYPHEFPQPYKSRRVACGKALYGALGIERDDVETRTAQWMKNYHGFGAPVELFIFLDAALEKGSWLDTGMFLQNIMLAARDHGLETCPQAAMSDYPTIVREELSLPDTLHLVCGIALGHPDPADPANNYRTEREEVDTFTRWFPQ